MAKYSKNKKCLSINITNILGINVFGFVENAVFLSQNHRL